MKQLKRCRVCGYDTEFRYLSGKYSLHKCMRCQFEQIAVDESFPIPLYKTDYFFNSKYKDVAALNKEYARRLRLLKKYLKTDSKVMDYGCAAGDFVKYAEKEFDISGCDISCDAINLARKRYRNSRFYMPDDLFNTKEQFDAFCLWDVIEHVQDPNDLVNKLTPLLKGGGYIILSTPDIGAIFAKITKTKWPFMTPPEHLSFFSKQSIFYFAKINGYDICDWSAKGKWVNMGFILYKFNKVSKVKIPQSILELFQSPFLSSMHVYVPTHDIQYVVLRKGKGKINQVE